MSEKWLQNVYLVKFANSWSEEFGAEPVVVGPGTGVDSRVGAFMSVGFALAIAVDVSLITSVAVISALDLLAVRGSLVITGPAVIIAWSVGSAVGERPGNGVGLSEAKAVVLVSGAQPGPATVIAVRASPNKAASVAALSSGFCLSIPEIYHIKLSNSIRRYF